jgi:hypothetical protein
VAGLLEAGPLEVDPLELAPPDIGGELFGRAVAPAEPELDAPDGALP